MDEPLRALDWWYPENEEGEPEAEAILAEINGWKTAPESENAPGVVKNRDKDRPPAPRQATRRLPQAQGRRFDRLRLLDLHRLLRFGRGEQVPPPRAARTLRARLGFRVAERPAHHLQPRQRATPTASRGANAKNSSGGTKKQANGPATTCPIFRRTRNPVIPPEPGAKGLDAIAGDAPFMLHADGRAWLFVAKGLADGPMPTHYEPMESPVRNALYPRQTNPGHQLVQPARTTNSRRRTTRVFRTC